MTPERAPRDEEGKVGRWEPRYWLCECDGTPNNIAESERCLFCGTVRPPLPETPAPRVEPIAGVDEAGRVKDAIVPLGLDERMALEDSQCFENCGACVNACGDAPDGMPFRVAVARRDIWHALRFASTTQAIAQLDEVAGRMGISPCGDAETVAAFHLRVTDAIVAALRAVPVEGRPLAAAITDHPVSVEDAVKLLREAEQELSGGDGNHEILGAECGVMADRIAALATPTLYAHPAPDARDAVDAARYRFLRDNPFQLRAIDGNAVWRGNVSAEDFDAHTDVAMANPAFTPTPSEDRPDAE